MGPDFVGWEPVVVGTERFVEELQHFLSYLSAQVKKDVLEVTARNSTLSSMPPMFHQQSKDIWINSYRKSSADLADYMDNQ